MEKIIDALSNYRFKDSDEATIEFFFSEINIYYEENPRHKYSEISKKVYKFNDDRTDIIRFNLQKIRQIAVHKNEVGIINKIDKLVDHTDLAENQRKLMEDVSKETRVLIKGLQGVLKNTADDLTRTKIETKRAKEELEETKEQIITAQGELEETNAKLNKNYDSVKRDINELKEEKNNIYTQFVTILGIFSAIIFASFGGLEILKNILGNISEASTPKLIVFSSFSIAGIISLLFILFNGLSRLTGKSIRSCDCEKNNIDCEHTVFTKHPTIMIVGFILFYTTMIGAFGYIVEYEQVFNIYTLPNIFNEGSKLTFALFLVIVPIAFYWFFYWKRKQDRDKDAL